MKRMISFTAIFVMHAWDVNATIKFLRRFYICKAKCTLKGKKWCMVVQLLTQWLVLAYNMDLNSYVKGYSIIVCDKPECDSVWIQSVKIILISF